MTPAPGGSGITISQDAEGRFSLNDLHKAAGGEDKDKPVHFLGLEATQKMLEALKVEKPTFSHLSVTKGKYGGSMAVKELVYRYAMWISPAFELKVIRAR